MSLRSMIREMTGEVGALSLRGLRSRPSSGRDRRVAPDEAARQSSCSAQLPPELLREVLGRVEESEPRWPRRRDVVACAGVCQSWRGAVREIVRVPEESGKLTFPSLSTLADDGKFLLAARKCHRPTCTEYLISLDRTDMSKGSVTCIGKLRSNFLRTKFTAYDAHPPHSGAVVSKRWSAGNYPVSHIYYDVNVLGSRGPRRMRCVMDSIPASAIEGVTAPTQTGFTLSNHDSFASIPFFKSKSSQRDSSTAPLSTQEESKLVLKNKSPRWQEHLQCWCLNFHGRVTVASVKNFQLVPSDGSAPTNHELDDVTLQFGKIGKDLFSMDYRYPLSAFRHSRFA